MVRGGEDKEGGAWLVLHKKNSDKRILKISVFQSERDDDFYYEYTITLRSGKTKHWRSTNSFATIGKLLEQVQDTLIKNIILEGK